MKARTLGAWCALALSIPLPALADETLLSLNRRLRVPVGPAGTATQVHRLRMLGRNHWAVVTPAVSLQGRCGAPLQRVSLWSEQPDRTVTETLSDTFDVCTRTPGELLSVSVMMVNGPEVRVFLSRPHMVNPTAMVRYHVTGDRYGGPHVERYIAATPDEAPRGSLASAPDTTLDGDVSAWAGLTPLARGTSRSLPGSVWVAQDGRGVRFAATVTAPEAPTLTLALAETGISTNTLLGRENNHGRFLTVRCDQPVPGAEVRCRRDGDRVTIEGRTDLGTMTWAAPTVSSVALHATLQAGARSITSDPSMRLRRWNLPVPVEFLAGASEGTRQACRGGYHTFLPVGGAASVLSCGARCTDGACEQHLPLDSPARVVIHRAGDGVCADVSGLGSEAFRACDPGEDRVQLLGTFPLVGFTTVIAVERAPAGRDARQSEVWAIVSPSAAWQRLWQGAERAPASLPRVDTATRHPRFCAAPGEGGCEVAQGITFVPPDPGGPVTNVLVRLGFRNARDGIVGL
ncbi:MAG: hypothetical protein HY909_04120 [Deltaproteobacteria bacterium]|nr:hypothetical protein [Deltaproteobacteria bacterium]